ncbi:MAG TPA: ankyrin repeat domain-containing protein [Verrucomicrobiae bacterium]|nr:ankyrin repeat domain-containing protein [Verrucomicrobiae bacterium]
MIKRWISIGRILLAGATLAGAATNDLAGLLQKGLFEEEANHDLNAAARDYQAVVSQFDAERKLAATAVFRLGECYRKQGNTNAANAQYNRIIQEFADQPTLADLSRKQLAVLGQAAQPAATFEQMQAADRQRASTLAESEEVRRIQAMIKDSPDLINAKDFGTGQTPLHKAAQTGQLTVATFLLDNGADVEAKEPPRFGGRTPLHLAASAGHKAVVDLLLSRHANVNATDSGGTTPLHLAAGKGFRSVAEVLLAAGADINARTGTGSTPLHVAAANGFKSLAELLIAHGADINANTSDVRDSADRTVFSGTALDIAAQRGDLSLAELLVTNKANVNAIARDGKTPLDFAAGQGNIQLAKLLLANGADINAKNPNEAFRDWTALDYAVGFDQEEMVELLLKHAADPNATFDDDLQKKWPNSSGNLNVREIRYTPLLLATYAEHTNTVDLLLEAKADPNLKDASGTAPIINAIYAADAAARLSMVQSLLEHGAQTEARDPQGRTPLIVAVWVHDKPCLELLLAHKADVNAKQESAGWTALDYVASGVRWNARPEPRAVSPLTIPSRPASSNFGTIQPGGGEAPASSESTEMAGLAELLLANGADVNSVSKEGKTPLELALEYRADPAIVELLRKHGGVANLPDFSSVRIGRKDSFQPVPILERDTNSLNHFSLLEVIARFYSDSGLPFPTGALGSLPFPDFSKVEVLRPVPGKLAERKEITIDLLTDGVNLDCTKDTGLQFGDVVDLPEREHPLSEQRVGLTSAQQNQLADCLRRKVTFIIKGESHPVTLSGANMSAYLSKALGLPEVQNLLRSSSDLSQVHVKRTEHNGQVKNLTEDVRPFWNGKQPLRNDIWLRNGDTVEVPSQ